MNKFVLAAIAGVLSTSTAFSADLLILDQPAVTAQTSAYDWSGFYAGVNLGYGWSEYELGDVAGTVVIDDIDGVLGGAQVGYNHDFGGFVLGAEADFQFSDLSRELAVAGIGSFDVGIESFGTVRARAGVAVDRFLPYVTGGVAWANGSATVVDALAGTILDEDETYVGYAIGAGLEYAVTDNITVKGEYLYADFGSKDFAVVGGTLDTDLTAHVARVGLNYKF
ncbi:MAG: porin family protein [Candidatus Devosia phytovorans]|uniref:Porin family protein n=1 Tax=Candidatus Devosia phytovorans TaxID=3121372 RepID=A0AAJ6B1F3_9HYPH|nr:outer membrane protein [Devosia sp.]WEK06740.1 MAG: porin family protein [Devosia sp.]